MSDRLGQRTFYGLQEIYTGSWDLLTRDCLIPYWSRESLKVALLPSVGGGGREPTTQRFPGLPGFDDPQFAPPQAASST